MSPTHTLPPCDCLDWCGDDERRIAQGKVQPCARFKERKLSAERDQLMYRLLHDMGYGVNMLAALQDLHQMRGERKVIMPLLRSLADKRRRGVFSQTEFIGEPKKRPDPEAVKAAWKAHDDRAVAMACGAKVTP